MRRLWTPTAAYTSSIFQNVAVGRKPYSTPSKYRIARREYEPGEIVPKVGEKPRVQMEVPSTERLDMSKVNSSFNVTMSEIVKGGTKKKRIALEGLRLIEDALLAGLRMEKLFLLKTIKEVPEKISTLMTKDVEIQKVGLKQMELWSSVTTPPGLIGVFPKPTSDTILKWRSTSSRLPVTVVCDNVREPGNLGSILRSAAGAGCKKALLSKGSVDPWDGKVLRGGSGAHFRFPIITDVPIHNLGSYFEVAQAQRSISASPSIGIFLADSNVGAETKFGIPTTSYQNVIYSTFDEVFVVFGGESEGISENTFKMISSLVSSFSTAGVPVFLSRIYISLDNDVESLNVANAFGIIVFEIKRQFELTKQLT